MSSPGTRPDADGFDTPPPLSVTDAAFDVGQHRLLEEVTFEAGGGSVIALVGPNGAGKSTMLSLLSADREPSAGTVLLDGAPMSSYRPAELARVRSVMVQQHTVQFAYTVAEIVAMGRMPHQVDEERDERLTQQAMRDADVARLADREVTTLSGGELSRAMFARVLAQHTPIMLLDEPTAALDLRHTELLMQVLRRRADAGCCVLVVLHDLNIAARFADRILMFAGGRLVADAPPAEALSAERIEDVYGQRVAVLEHPTSGSPLIVPVG